MVTRWDIITIGNLSRNRYWGESDERPRRPAICTCTLLTGEGFRLLVDPSLADGARMAEELDRRAGLGLSAITHVFVTHHHGDHHFGLKHFPEAEWFAAPEVAAILNVGLPPGKRVQSTQAWLLGDIDVLPTPGHTPSHHSLRFGCSGRQVVIAGDAVMTEEFFVGRRGYFNSMDFEQASRTIEELAGIADIIVPGHDNHFLV